MSFNFILDYYVNMGKKNKNTIVNNTNEVDIPTTYLNGVKKVIINARIEKKKERNEEITKCSDQICKHQQLLRFTREIIMETMDDNDAIIRIHNKYLSFVKQYDDTNNESLLPSEEFFNKNQERSFHIRNIYAEQFGKRTFYDDIGGNEAENIKNFYILKKEDKYEINDEVYTVDGKDYNFEEKWKKLINFIYEHYLNKRHDSIKDDTRNALIIKGLHKSVPIDNFINHLDIYSDWLMFFFIYESLYAVNEENKKIFMDLAIYLNEKNTIPIKILMDKTGTLKILAEKYDDDFLKKLMPEETLSGFTPSSMYMPEEGYVDPYDLATEEDENENKFGEIEEGNFGGGRKKTRRKKQNKTKRDKTKRDKTKRDKTKRDKTHKKNKKRTRRMKRRA